MDYVIAMFEHRPYVIALVATFLLVAPAERGFLRAGIWLVTGTFIGWAVEASSIRTGFPFGNYVYLQENFADELWIAGVPLFASLSFAALTYFGHSLAYTLLSPLKRDAGIRRIEDESTLLSIKVLLLATIIITWIDLVVDPVTHLGEYWWLGQIYYYHPEGFHFGVPLSNYAGWLFTGFSIVLVNQVNDWVLWKQGYEFKGAYQLPNRPLWGLFCFGGNYIFILVVTVMLMTDVAVPEETPLMAILASGVFFSSVFFVFTFAMIRRGLRIGSEQSSSDQGTKLQENPQKVRSEQVSGSLVGSHSEPDAESQKLLSL